MDTATAVTRYAISGLPWPDSPTVFVSAAQTTVNQTPRGGFSRWDSITWSFVDPRSNSELIDAAAAAAGITGGSWDVLFAEAFQAGDGSKCVQSEIGGGGAMWTLIVCSHPDGTRTLQVVREGYVESSPAPEVLGAVAADTDSVAAAVGGTLAGWDVVLEVPSNTPTNRMKVVYATAQDPASLADTLRSVLQGWSETGDDGYDNTSFNNGALAWKIPNHPDGTIAFTTPDFADWT